MRTGCWASGAPPATGAKLRDMEKRNKKPSQKALILRHMLAGRSITPLEALRLYGCFRLGARIADIKADGFLVHTEMVTDKETGKRYARYSLV